MEGWTTACLGLDAVFAAQAAGPRIDIGGLEASLRESEGFLLFQALFEERLAREAWAFAVNRPMIPLVRGIDHLALRLADPGSALGRVLQAVDGETGAIGWRPPPA